MTQSSTETKPSTHFLQPGEPIRPTDVRGELAALWTLAWPVVMARLGIMVMGLADAVVVGRYSARELGYHALAWAPASVALTVAVGLLMGVQVMTARAIGEGRRVEAGAVLRRGVVYAFWIGMASTVIIVVGAPPGLRAIGLEPDLAEGASRAAVVFSYSLTTYIVSCAFSFWLEALARPMASMATMWLANVVNVILLLWLVPGTSGLPVVGAVAAAWATFGARAVLLISLMVYVALLPEARELGVFRRAPRERGLEREQRRIGYGGGASNFFEVSSFASLNVIAGWVGTLSVAAWAVVLNVIGVVFMVPLGLATAVAVLVGNAYGARDRPGVLRAAYVGFAVTAAFGVAVSLVVLPFASLLVSGYTTDLAVIAMAAPALALCSLFFLADGVQVVVAHALRARGDVLMPAITHMASYILIMMPLAWWLTIPAGFGLIGMVWAVIIASFIAAGLLLGRFWMLAPKPL
ncbi:MATE family efflux transporter [Phenylobacterium sp.]|uniref:MATE family efflux transporter n=1 Tax=Phenylobacterium sp. TaxID=1871053 RepID=UPI003523DD5C